MSRFVEIHCYRCKEPFGLSPATYETLVRQAESGQFFCPHGHKQHFASGETEAEKLRRERDRLKQQIAMQEDWRKDAEARAEAEKRRAAAFKGQATRLRTRAKAGICPCCNRHFTALERHMATKHPDFQREQPDLQVIDGGKAA